MESRQYDAVFTEIQNHNGEWVTSTTIDGTFNYNLSCKGTECASAAKAEGLTAQLPCESQIAYTGKKQ
jgi:succinate dehydrogenase/fumarate reductase-like Fe-S protein